MDSDIGLSDFCGSPGFFEPEMVIKDTYFGDKADLWSAGCVILEMVLGHEVFSEAWMHPYELESVKVKKVFTERMSEAVHNLPKVLNISTLCRDFILRMLKVDSRERTSMKEALGHTFLDSEVSAAQARGSPSVSLTSPLSSSHNSTIHKAVSSLSLEDLAIEGINSYDNSMRRGELDTSLSQREWTSALSSETRRVALPPVVEPQTPNMASARKFLPL
jgi:serine/threonine protein kinase